jgi:hypothetical protein
MTGGRVIGRANRIALTFVIRGHCDLNAVPIRCVVGRAANYFGRETGVMAGNLPRTSILARAGRGGVDNPVVIALAWFTGATTYRDGHGQRVAAGMLEFYLLRTLRPSFTMRAPRVAAAPLSTPFVIVSLCSVPNFLAEATIGSAAAWNPSSKAPEPVAAS